MIPLLTLDLALDGYTLAVTFTASLVGPTTVTTTAFPSGTTKRNHQDTSASDNVLKAVKDALNAAETAAGTNGVWTVPTAQMVPLNARFKRTTANTADRISSIAISSGLASILGLDPTTTPTHQGNGEYVVQTRVLGGAWTCNRHAREDLRRATFTVHYARSPAGYSETLAESSGYRRDVVIENVPGCFVLLDAFERAETWRQVSGLTADDTNAPLEVFWARMLGNGAGAPNTTLRYYPNREDVTQYQEVLVDDARALGDPVGARAWEQTNTSPSLWRLALPLVDRS